jgi:hypothetical protein
MSEGWISADTEEKERHFRGILDMHVKICKGIRRTGDPPYLYVDCHAGRGHLEYGGRTFLGSPLIAQEILTREAIPHEAIHYEVDAREAALLAEARWVPTSLLDVPDPTTAPIYVQACEEGLPAWLVRQGRQPYRHGLVYADPIGKELPHEMLGHVAHTMPRVDILAYVSATGYKRRNGARLVDHIEAVGKQNVLIREKRGPWQWTFLLFTNWDGFPEWHTSGFHRLNSEAGQRILEELNLTKRELHEARNTPLPFPVGAAVPDVPGVPEAPPVPGHSGAGVQEGAGHV